MEVKHTKKEWKEEIQLAEKVCKERGLTFVPVFRNYILFKLVGLGVAIVAYPHTNKNRHTACRVRDENSKNKELALEIMDELDERSGFNNRFYRKVK